MKRLPAHFGEPLYRLRSRDMVVIQAYAIEMHTAF
jgi:hypothetical protein